MKTKGKPPEKLVDPAVTRVKYEREVELYRQNADDYIARGWWMVKATFPEVVMVLGTPNLVPAIAPFGALIDFTNYDILPPSVRLIHPFTQVPYTSKEVPIPPLPRRVMLDEQNGKVEHLLQSPGPDEEPFICVPGIREYHQHPAHSGDSWFVHRNRGEGTLYFILNLLSTYGIGAVKGYSVQMEIKAIGLEGPQKAEDIPE